MGGLVWVFLMYLCNYKIWIPDLRYVASGMTGGCFLELFDFVVFAATLGLTHLNLNPIINCFTGMSDYLLSLR